MVIPIGNIVLYNYTNIFINEPNRPNQKIINFKHIIRKCWKVITNNNIIIKYDRNNIYECIGYLVFKIPNTIIQCKVAYPGGL